MLSNTINVYKIGMENNYFFVQNTRMHHCSYSRYNFYKNHSNKYGRYHVVCLYTALSDSEVFKTRHIFLELILVTRGHMLMEVYVYSLKHTYQITKTASIDTCYISNVHEFNEDSLNDEHFTRMGI